MSTSPTLVRRNSPLHLTLLAVGALVVVAAIFWGYGLQDFNRGQVTRVMIYAVAIAGLNIASGYSGLISVGHSAFFGLGAYTTGVLVVRYGWSAEWTIPVAFVVCFVAGLIVGLPALRIRGLYLAMVTLAFGVAFPELIGRFDSFTGGAEGLTIRNRMLRPPDWTGFKLGEKDKWLYWVAVVVLLFTMLAVHNLVRSRYGLALVAARDNEIAAAASGVNLAVAKTVAFGVSGALTGIGGSLFAMYLGTLVAGDSFTLLSAISLLTGLVIGGQATRFGPILGAVAVVYIPYYTSDIGQGQAAAVLFGAVLIAIIFVAPEGLTGGFFRLFHKYVVLVPSVAGRTPALRQLKPDPTPEPAAVEELAATRKSN
ncbi:MAG TPA: branched-chain amino acid ABC transporter permease [Jatrophihabitans sp.]|jgi:branched-chain amino acid transport system permease protein|uniref:branched-chain amino acid ABC transporter permease n=1 Tax=Jatrophihabitans sp. TaxID=1932789 RepID=UPI002E0A8FCD|nr:branched-chain amino acid ABC transporter permease [Jatrophihabitans sp.]